MIDGEGTVTNFRGDRRRHPRMVSISNTDPAIIAAITACCDVLGLTYRMTTDVVGRWPTRKPQWADITHVKLYGRRNFQVLLDVVPIQAPEKRRRLEVIAASYIDRVVISPADVRRLYHDSGHTQAEVASLLGVGVRSLARVMRNEGIHSRTWDSMQRGWATRRSHNPEARKSAQTRPVVSGELAPHAHVPAG
jgi:hypothetical protein